MPTPSSTAWSITPTGLTSTGKACGEPVNPAERPEPVALWTCRCAWTTPRGVAHMPTAEAAEKQVLKPRFKIDHAALPMPENRRPERLAPRATSNRKCGRDHLGILGEIKSVHPGEIVGISNLHLHVDGAGFDPLKRYRGNPRDHPAPLLQSRVAEGR